MDGAFDLDGEVGQNIAGLNSDLEVQVDKREVWG